MKVKSILKIVVLLIIAGIATILLINPKETAKGFKDGIHTIGQ